MAITVEFFGIPRVRAGVQRMEMHPECGAAKLSEILREVAQRIPGFAEACMSEDGLGEHFIASIDGERFIRDEDVLIEDQRTVLILSADAGG